VLRCGLLPIIQLAETLEPNYFMLHIASHSTFGELFGDYGIYTTIQRTMLIMSQHGVWVSEQIEPFH
jgi:hypothetical protein